MPAIRLSPRRSLWLMVGLIALAFGLRLYRLDAVPLRGDEAFTVRYWADAPLTVLRNLADHEPHPVGTFLAFYAWKQTAGESAFAMRYLPLLGSVIGVTAIAALARRLFRDDRVALLAALLWAIHPFLIWHAQDVRNYALWSGLSPLALWLFLRAADLNRPRDWALYVLAAALAFYSFFLEIFLIPLEALYLALYRRRKAVIVHAVFSWSVLLILLLPWLAQAYYLSQSGYRGAVEDADPVRMLTWILPTLLTGDTLGTPWDTLIACGWLVLAGLALWNLRPRDQRRFVWFATWISLPALLLLIAATRMSVFHPRYLLAITPALMIVTARALIPTERPTLSWHGLRVAAPLVLVIVPLLGLISLRDYYTTDTPKAPDWPALTAYLDARVTPGDLIVQNMPDPAFAYYYRGPTDEMSLEPRASAAAQLRPQINFYHTIWMIGRAPDAEAFLDESMQRVSFHTVSGFSVMQYRAWLPDVDEPQHTAEIQFAGPDGEPIASLHGYTIQGPDPASRAITVLLYWEPLAQTTIDYKVFVHLVGAPKPDGSPLWDQDDHRPLYGFASTTTWGIGTLLRDPYHLLEDPATPIAAGDYTLHVGFYDPATNTRLSAYDAAGGALGDSFVLPVTIRFPAQ